MALHIFARKKSLSESPVAAATMGHVRAAVYNIEVLRGSRIYEQRAYIFYFNSPARQ
jgi:hypothetical protein